MAAPAVPDVSSTLEHADEAARAAAERLAAAGQHLRSQALTASDELRARVDDLRDRVDETDLEPVVRRAQMGGWQLLRALLGAAAALPRLLPRGLAALSTAVDDVAERGADVSERARELASAVPASRRERRRRRLRGAAWAGAGFGVGLGVGWLLARRTEPYVADDVDEDVADAAGLDMSHNGPVTRSSSTAEPGQRA